MHVHYSTFAPCGFNEREPLDILPLQGLAVTLLRQPSGQSWQAPLQSWTQQHRFLQQPCFIFIILRHTSKFLDTQGYGLWSSESLGLKNHFTNNTWLTCLLLREYKSQLLPASSATRPLRLPSTCWPRRAPHLPGSCTAHTGLQKRISIKPMSKYQHTSKWQTMNSRQWLRKHRTREKSMRTYKM